MEIIEALNIVSDFIEGEYQYQDEEGEWYVKPEAIKAMQYLINYGMLQHMAEWYRPIIEQLIVDGILIPNPDDPFTSLERFAKAH